VAGVGAHVTLVVVDHGKATVFVDVTGVTVVGFTSVGAGLVKTVRVGWTGGSGFAFVDVFANVSGSDPSRVTGTAVAAMVVCTGCVVVTWAGIALVDVIALHETVDGGVPGKAAGAITVNVTDFVQ